ncbi:hypothetical protein SO694_0010802 [Aureococcus anophagefferens]|uniref:Uncharacterized protein n=1 Tax=Aureococcus anophagefferens TaxID=44056 RepID=A0ABR1FM73_AURAN
MSRRCDDRHSAHQNQDDPAARPPQPSCSPKIVPHGRPTAATLLTSPRSSRCNRPQRVPLSLWRRTYQ